MNKEDKARLQNNRVKLVEELKNDTNGILDSLYKSSIVTPDDMERVNAEPARADRVRLLLDILPTKGPDAFRVFISTLKEMENFEHLIRQLMTSN